MKKYADTIIRALRSDRKHGYSILRLMEKYNMPKTTVWHHVHDVALNSQQRRILRSTQGGSKQRRESQLLRACSDAKNMLVDVDIDKAGPVILAALYWAEGNKREFVFTNTDERMIRLFLVLLRKHWHVEEQHVHLLLRLTGGMNREKCIRYWHTKTGIPSRRIVLDINSMQNKTKTKYGICRIVLKKGGYNLKLTHAVIDEMCASMLR